MLRFYFFYSADEKRQVDKGVIDDFGTFSNILVVAIVVSAMTYALLSYLLLNRHKKLIGDNFSNTENINLNWLKGFIYGVIVIFITVIIVLVTRDIMGILYPFNPELIFYSMIVFAVLGLGYFGIRHENIFTDNVVIELDRGSKGNYKSSSLKENMATDKHKALKKLMVEQKPYLEPNLTLNALADKLDISLHHLSQIINQFEGQNFNDFVNKYRVEEFINRASLDSHFSFLGIALDSGFNSKSTFNAVFRKHKGLTPSQYLSSLKK
jgi:AraC-like DNA-binding protein